MLCGKPVLTHTIEKFSCISEKIILVLNPSFIDYWGKICFDFAFTTPHTIVEGGKTRTDSVKNGLAVIKDDGIVAIHDAVRPLVSRKLIEKLFDVAEKKGNAVPIVVVKDSLRKIEKEKNYSVDRKDYMAVQTPQCFRINKLKAAYNDITSKKFTDDASVFEEMGEKINLVEGESFNIKITEAHDLKIAEALFMIPNVNG
jgi:2-C-methyl-D-erythritol 4-phosphate cytidylyltransferase